MTHAKRMKKKIPKNEMRLPIAGSIIKADGKKTRH
jgi:hypothetical protein